MRKKYIYNICTGLLIAQFLIAYATLWFNFGKDASQEGLGGLYFFTFYFTFTLIYGLALSFGTYQSKNKSIFGAIFCGFPIVLVFITYLAVGTGGIREGSLGLVISSGIILSLCVTGYVSSIFVKKQ